MDKTLRDLHRAYCYERFGGLEWMHFLIAIGRLDEDILLSLQEALRESHRRRKEEQKRASAPPRGKALHEAAKWQAAEEVGRGQCAVAGRRSLNALPGLAGFGMPGGMVVEGSLRRLCAV